MAIEKLRLGRSVDSRIVTVAIVLTLGNLAICIHRSSRVYLFQQSQCLQHFLVVDKQRIDDQWQVDEAQCKIKEVQSPLSMIEGVDAFLQLLPALLVMPTYQTLLPMIGLRRFLMINLFFLGCGVFLSTFFYSLHQPWTNAAILLTFVCDLLGGGDVTRITACLTVIAGLLPPDRLTNTNNYISALYIFASVGGSAIGSILLSHHVYILNFIGIICALIAIIFTMLVPKHLGQDMKSPKTPSSSINGLLLSDDGNSQEDLFDDPPLKTGRTQDIPQVILTSWKSSFAAIAKLFNIANPTYTVIMIFLLNSFTNRVEVIGPQYISLTLSWSLASVNSLLATKALVSACILLSLPSLRKKYLEPRMNSQQIDLLIIQASLVLNTFGMAGLGFPLPTPLFMAILYVYTSGVGVYDSLTTYGRATLPANEKMSDFFVRCGLVQTIAGLVAAPLWSGLFSICLTSTFLPIGLPFWVSAGLFGGVFILSRRLRGQATYSTVP